MKRIIIDLDDVITTSDGWLHVINTFLGTNYTEQDGPSYYLQDLVPKDKWEDYLAYFRTQNTYDFCKINEDCVEVIKELNEKYDIYICSAYVYRDDVMYSADALKYKFEFLIKNFPFIEPKKFVFLNNKNIIKCDIRIDDKLSNLEEAKTKILFTAYHNKTISNEELKERNVVRVNNWKEIKNILL